MPTKKLFLALLCWSTLGASVFIKKTNMSYDHTASGTCGELFVAATNPAAGKETLSVALAVPGVSDGVQQVALQGLVPSSTQINGATQTGGSGSNAYYIKKNEPNPLYNNKIHWFSAYNNMPLAVCGANADSAQTLVSITNLVDGSSIRTNKNPVRDADGAVAGTIKAAVGGARVIPSTGPFDVGTNHNVVFAAVTPNGATTFAGQDAAGIAVLYNHKGGLIQVDATGGRSATPKAVSLPHSLIQIDGEGEITGISSMYWDSTIQRLFIGLTLNTGGVAVVVGQLERVALTNEEVQGPHDKEPQLGRADVKLTLRPIVSVSDWNTDDYFVAEKDSGRSINSVTTLHTSTNRSFVVFSRGGGAVYALPIVNGVGKHRDDPNIGLLAQETSVTDVATSVEHLLNNAISAQPGQGVFSSTAIQLYTRGDVVYASFGTTGLFSATYAPYPDGRPGVWSEWQIVATAIDNIYLFSVDILGRLQFVTGVDTDSMNTVHAMVWGQGDNNLLWGGTADDASAGLVAQINAIFTREEGGVHAVRTVCASNFALAPWHEQSGNLDDSAMLMALGKNRCVVAMTYSDGTFINSTNLDAAAHLANYNLVDDGLDLGILTSSVFCLNGTTGEEWLFVGGETGLAVRSKTNGEGPGAQVTEISQLGTGFRFKELKKADGSSFSQVRSLHTAASDLYVLDATGLYRIAMTADKFKDTGADAIAEDLIATATNLLGSSEQQLLHFFGMGAYGYLCTTAGLWIQKSTDLSAVDDVIGTGGWQELPLTPGGTDSFGVCVDATAVSYKITGTGQGPGIIQVLAADTSLNIATVYRLAASDTDITASIPTSINHTITGNPRYYTTMLGQLRDSFYSDGAYMFDVGSQHHILPRTVNGRVRVLPLSSSMNTVDAWNASLVPSLEITSGVHTVGKIVRDYATGTLILPTNMGIRILQ